MSATRSALRRVAVHADTTAADLTLPATVAVAELIPSILDTLGLTPVPARYRLAQPGLSPLPGSTTLAQNDIRDGALLILSREEWRPPAPRCDDVAEAVSATLRTGTRAPDPCRRLGALAAATIAVVGAVLTIRNAIDVGGHAETTAAVAAASGAVALTAAALAHRVFRDSFAGFTLSVVAAVFAWPAGLLAVPGPPGAPHVLLAATATALVAAVGVLSVPTVRDATTGAITMTALACWAGVTAAVALAAVITAAPTHVIGSLSAVLSLGLIEAAPRLSIWLAGLTPALPVQPESTLETDLLAIRARTAESRLISLVAAFSASAAASVIVAALTSRRAILLAVVAGVVLLLRTRSIEGPGKQVLGIFGIIITATTFGLHGGGLIHCGPWLTGLAAALVAAALSLGFIAPTVSFTPLAHRGMQAMECLTLAAVVPLACWVCGAFSAVRGLDLLRR